MISSFFTQHADQLKKAAETDKVKAIRESEEYYFQKARDKYGEYLQLNADQAVLDSLIDQTDKKPFSFERLLTSYDQDSIEYKTLKIIGELISYIDQNAAMKNTLNEYPDKRTIALAFVRQNVWVKYLLKFKSGTSLEDLPEVIQNALHYLEHPELEIAVLKEDRRKLIQGVLFEEKEGNLFQAMQDLKIQAKNPLNNGYLYSVILHSENIRPLWEKSKEKILKGTGKEQRIWVYALGKNDYKWDEFRKKRIMAIGWDKIGGLTKFQSKEEIKNELTRIYGPENGYANDGLALWQF